MTDCKTCEYPILCLAFRTAEDYIGEGGNLRQIIGCTETEYIFGDPLTDLDIKQIEIELRGAP